MKTLVVFCAATLAAIAQTPTIPQEALGKAPVVTPAPHRFSVHNAAAASAAGMLYEPLVTADAPLTVPPGGFQILTCHLEFTGTRRVALAVLGADNVTDLTALRLSPAWAGSGMFYTLTDISGSSAFSLAGSGGMTTPVYGSFLKVGLINSGNSPLQLKQLTVYAVLQ